MELNDQFLVSAGARPHPDGWLVVRAGRWTLASSPTLPVTPLLDEHGTTSGWLLGWVVGPDGEFLHRRPSLPLDEVQAADGDVEGRLYRFAGRWACVLLTDRPRVHLDPAASLAAVFSEQEEAVASTTTVLHHGDQALSERFEHRTLKPGQFFPAGLTSDPKVHRVLPNHLLDLTSWQTRRHWPPAPVERVDARDERAVAERQQAIADGVRHTIESIAAHHHVLLPLTAGRDSRLLVAASRRVLDRCTFVCFAYEDQRASDLAFAKEVARRFDLDLRVLPLEHVDERTAREYLDRVGYDANEGKAGDFLLAAGRLPLDHAWLTGFAGEVGRGEYWKASDLPRTPSDDDLLRLVRLPADPAHRDALAAWRDQTPHQDVEELLDLAYLEMRVGCWASPQLYGAAPFALSTIPVNRRDVFSAMLQLPTDLRAAQRTAPLATSLNWPELGSLPYGRAPGVRGWPDALSRGAQRLRDRAAVGTRVRGALRR